MSRQTMKVKDYVIECNRLLALPDRNTEDLGSDPQSWRRGILAALEGVLWSTDNYHGFGYQESEFDAPGALRHHHDDTRRRYFTGK